MPKRFVVHPLASDFLETELVLAAMNAPVGRGHVLSHFSCTALTAVLNLLCQIGMARIAKRIMSDAGIAGRTKAARPWKSKFKCAVDQGSEQ